MQPLDQHGEIIEATEVPGGWVGPVQTKSPDQYLSNAIWVGDATPKWSMGPPYGLGSDACVFVTAYQRSDRSPKGWSRRRVFASMEPDLLVPAAAEWLAGIVRKAR